MKKKIYADETGRTPKQATAKRKTTPYIESPVVRQYRHDRDMSMLSDPAVSEETKIAVKEKYAI